MLRNNNPIIFLSNLKDSYKDYKDMEIDDELYLYNFKNNFNKYKINKIIHSNNLDTVYKYNDELIVVVKDYFALNYTIVLFK